MATAETVNPAEESEESGTKYDELLAQAREERGDPLLDSSLKDLDRADRDGYRTGGDQGRSDDVVRDKSRAYGAKPHVEVGLRNEERAVQNQVQGEDSPYGAHYLADARSRQEDATGNFYRAREAAAAAGKAYDKHQAHHRRGGISRRALRLWCVGQGDRAQRQCHNQSSIRWSVHGRRDRLPIPESPLLRPIYRAVFDDRSRCRTYT